MPGPAILTDRYGPLPGYAWIGVAAGGAYLFVKIRNRGTAGSSSSADTTGAGNTDPGAGTPADPTGGGYTPYPYYPPPAVTPKPKRKPKAKKPKHRKRKPPPPRRKPPPPRRGHGQPPQVLRNPRKPAPPPVPRHRRRRIRGNAGALARPAAHPADQLYAEPPA